MLLVIDVGNTNTVLGVFQGGRLRFSWRVSTRRDQTADESVVLVRSLFEMNRIDQSKVKSVVVSSVVPPLNDRFKEMIEVAFGINPVFVDPVAQTLIPIRYNPVSDVGADRIVNALAAYELFGGPTVVVDFGTATTFDAISSKGEYLGGIIAPGIGISAEALFTRAAKLPRIEIRRPPEAIGQSTVASMQSGIFYGYVGLVEGILTRLRSELGKITVIATGGQARLICGDSDAIDQIEDDLTLQGLRLYHERMN